MNPEKELKEAHERNLIGWDRSTVVKIIGQAINLLNASMGSIEEHLATWQKKVDHDFAETWSRVASLGDAMYEEVQSMNKKVDYGILRRHYAESQQLRKAITDMSDMILGNPVEIIKLSKDVTTIAEKLITMNEKVSKQFPDVGSKESDEYLDYLTADQARKVMEWVEENKAAGIHANQ